MPTIGPTELIIVLAIVLLVFGPKRLPSLGRQLGSGMREFKDSVTGRSGDEEDGEDAEDGGRPAAIAAGERDDAAAGRRDDAVRRG